MLLHRKFQLNMCQAQLLAMQPYFLSQIHPPVDIADVGCCVSGHRVIQGHQFVQRDEALSFRLVPGLNVVFRTRLHSPEI